MSILVFALEIGEYVYIKHQNNFKSVNKGEATKMQCDQNNLKRVSKIIFKLCKCTH